MSLSITAQVELTDSEDGGYTETVVVTVEGRNMSEELVKLLAAHAACLEIGCGDYEFEESFNLEDVDLNPDASVVTFQAVDQS